MEDRGLWVKNFLTGKLVKKKELDEFFEIENNYKVVKPRKIGDNTYSYITDSYEYTVKILPVPNTTTTFIIAEVTYEIR